MCRFFPASPNKYENYYAEYEAYKKKAEMLLDKAKQMEGLVNKKLLYKAAVFFLEKVILRIPVEYFWNPQPDTTDSIIKIYNSLHQAFFTLAESENSLEQRKQYYNLAIKSLKREAAIHQKSNLCPNRIPEISNFINKANSEVAKIDSLVQNLRAQMQAQSQPHSQPQPQPFLNIDPNSLWDTANQNNAYQEVENIIDSISQPPQSGLQLDC